MPVTDQPFPTNPVIAVVNPAIDGVFGVAVKAAEAALIATDPAVFGNIIIQKIDDAVIRFIANAIYKNFATWVSFEIIDFTDSAQVSDSQKALVALKAAQSSGDADALAKALKDFDQATGTLTHMDGAGLT